MSQTTWKAFLRIKDLKAVLLFAGRRDIRWHLNAVHVTATSRSTTLTSTDGRRFGRIERKFDNTVAETVSVIVPRDAVSLAIGAASGRVPNPPPVELTRTGDEYMLFNPVKSLGVRFTPIEATYPDLSKVIPAAPSGIAANYNWQYLNDFEKAGQTILGGSWRCGAILQQNGDGAALVTIVGCPEFTGAVMPMKW